MTEAKSKRPPFARRTPDLPSPVISPEAERKLAELDALTTGEFMKMWDRGSRSEAFDIFRYDPNDPRDSDVFSSFIVAGGKLAMKVIVPEDPTTESKRVVYYRFFNAESR